MLLADPSYNEGKDEWTLLNQQKMINYHLKDFKPLNFNFNSLLEQWKAKSFVNRIKLKKEMLRGCAI
jgi:hypothetical protein